MNLKITEQVEASILRAWTCLLQLWQSNTQVNTASETRPKPCSRILQTPEIRFQGVPVRPSVIRAWGESALILFPDLMSTAFNAWGSVAKAHIWKLQMFSQYLLYYSPQGINILL